MGNEEDERASLEAHYSDRSYVNPVNTIDQSDRSRMSHQLSVTERRDMANRAKDVPCRDCGVKYPSYVMDLDHVRGVKVADISQMIQKHCTLQTLQRELAKCEAVCSNCHRERTWGRQKLDNAAYGDL